MPTVGFRGREIECERGAVLRDVLLDAGETPHNGAADLANCRGHGTCGTCAVAVDGETTAPTTAERVRLSVPPHDPDGGLRLACQTRVLGDLDVEKHPGFWGQHVGGDAAGDDRD
ncbi:MAG: 2Fe-2S iron-sulfur cluster-binding protein [Haloferacaceae archaeon]